jgi:putative transcriptional regulator
MPIIVNLDVQLARRKMSLGELSECVGLSLTNLSILKTGKAKAIRFSTLEKICGVLECSPGDLLEYSAEHFSKVVPVPKFLDWPARGKSFKNDL